MSSRDEYVELLKSTALSMGKDAVLKILLAQLPAKMVTGFWGAMINPILGLLVQRTLEIAIRETAIGAFFLYIDMRTSAQGRDFEKAAAHNVLVQLTGTEEEKARAEKELINRFRSLIKLTN